LPEYSDVSKDLFDKPDGNIRLYETGAFYESFKVLVRGIDAEILANRFKATDTGTINLYEIYGEEIIGLTEESKIALAEVMVEPIQRFNKMGLSVD